jgi:hypothetical protein
MRKLPWRKLHILVEQLEYNWSTTTYALEIHVRCRLCLIRAGILLFSTTQCLWLQCSSSRRNKGRKAAWASFTMHTLSCKWSTVLWCNCPDRSCPAVISISFPVTTAYTCKIVQQKTTEFSSLAFLLIYGFILPSPITSPNPHPAYMCIMFILVVLFLRDEGFKTKKKKFVFC